MRLPGRPTETACISCAAAILRIGRENPNPGMKAVLPDQSIWMVKIDEGKPVKLGEGKAPAVSPNGDLVAFIKKGELWTMAPDGKNAASTVAVQGKIENLRWSPDGSAIAFVNDRTSSQLDWRLPFFRPQFALSGPQRGYRWRARMVA